MVYKMINTFSKAIIAVIILFSSVSMLFAQVKGVGIGTDTPDVNAVLDIKDSLRGVLLPRTGMPARMSMASPATGMTLYQIADEYQGLYYYAGMPSEWQRVAAIIRVPNQTARINMQSSATQLVFQEDTKVLWYYDGTGSNGWRQLGAGASTSIDYVPDEASRPVSPAAGQYIYQADTKHFYYWDGTNWLMLGEYGIQHVTFATRPVSPLVYVGQVIYQADDNGSDKKGLYYCTDAAAVPPVWQALGGYEIEHVAALPATGVSGQMVFLTTDSKFYAWNVNLNAWMPVGTDEILHVADASARPVAPFDGQLIYQLDNKRFYYWNAGIAPSGGWVELGADEILHKTGAERVALTTPAITVNNGQLVYQTDDASDGSIRGLYYWDNYANNNNGAWKMVGDEVSHVTQATRPANPKNGQMIYQTDGKNGLYYWDATVGSWKMAGDDISHITETARLTLASTLNAASDGRLVYQTDSVTTKKGFYYWDWNAGSGSWKMTGDMSTTSKLSTITTTATGGIITVNNQNYIPLTTSAITAMDAGTAVIGQVVVFHYVDNTPSAGTALTAIIPAGTITNVKLRQAGSAANATQPAEEPFYNIKNTTITFMYDGTNWIEIARTQAVAP